MRKHGSNRTDAEYVVKRAQAPFPREVGDGKYLVWGQTETAQFLEVVFAFRVAGQIEFASLTLLDWAAVIDYGVDVAICVCHAMPMKERQIKQYRRLRSSQ